MGIFISLHWECFNPRSRVGSDGKTPILRSGKAKFQSTLPCRERLRKVAMTKEEAMFQSTLPRRERHRLPNSDFQVHTGFNPRSRVGSDD